MKKNQMKKTILRRGVGVAMAFAMVLSLAGNSSVAHAKSQEGKVDGVSVKATVTDGRSSGKTKATLTVTNGPALGLQVESRIYYRFGEFAFYVTSEQQTRTATSFSLTATKGHAGAEVDQCRGIFRTRYMDGVWDPTINIGTLNPNKTYIKYKK